MKKTLPDHEIFRKYFTKQDFVDRFKIDKKEAIDVIIPIIHTNELWEQNLISIYREIPVNRLLISDGGCIDNSLEVLKKFPRVKIYDHKKFTSLGYCIRKLIEEVKTDWFVYLHSDVYLPPGWYEIMERNQKKYDWFECRQHITALIDYPLDYTDYNRPLSGSQMGRKKSFEAFLDKIDDDYLYRNEDLVFADLVKRYGGRYGRVDETYHFHQLMNKKSKWRRDIRGVSFNVKKSPKEEKREFMMQVRGLIKYTNPDQYLIKSMQGSLREALRVDPGFGLDDFRKWAKDVNPKWLPFIKLPKKSENLFIATLGLAKARLKAILKK